MRDTKIASLGAAITEARNGLGLTMAQFAEKVGIGAPSTIVCWEKNRNFPRESKWALLAELLDTTVEEIGDLYANFKPAPRSALSESFQLGEGELEYLLGVVKATGVPIPMAHATYYLERRQQEQD